MVKEAARSLTSNTGSYSNSNNNAHTAGSIHMYALAHAYTSANSAHSSGTSHGTSVGRDGMSVSIPHSNNNSGGYAIPGAAGTVPGERPIIVLYHVVFVVFLPLCPSMAVTLQFPLNVIEVHF